VSAVVPQAVVRRPQVLVTRDSRVVHQVAVPLQQVRATVVLLGKLVVHLVAISLVVLGVLPVAASFQSEWVIMAALLSAT